MSVRGGGEYIEFTGRRTLPLSTKGMILTLHRTMEKIGKDSTTFHGSGTMNGGEWTK
jgi:hypothetical protein